MWFELMQGVAAVAALVTLPGSWSLARWTWAARRRSASPRLAPLNVQILLLVPAHNEAANLPQTLPRLVEQAQSDGNCNVLVIADHCTDNTAEVARACGAMVFERDEGGRGKGCALAAAFAFLPDVPWYLIVDADSRLDANFLAVLRCKMAENPDGIQTRYEPDCASDDANAPLRHWALHAFNVIRPRGRAALGEGVGLLGNGFALANTTLQRVPYQAGSIVEDLEYQLSLAAAHCKLAWLEDVAVYGEMPQGDHAKLQRQRWEGGRLAMIRRNVLPLMLRICRGETHLWPILQELTLLPLIQHMLLLLLACIAGGWPLYCGLIGLFVLMAHIGMALLELPRAMRRAALSAAPMYIVWKIMQLPNIFRGSRSGALWQRSVRHIEQEKT
ncbi:glycosyltransferase family 2 protein [Deefgea salmonis]|uniref:Glycosyltransferase family 2 protein n=1 Tax=Deefgea salmonis TaxID=2875502 RepID=A0ABS8BNN8_9NEIS|nr:glycosyltransferase family 2 protein [Deefgea salmonis]MCB5197352.1 glycosyltransferase family 2 protein [Deefgea salmonis]